MAHGSFFFRDEGAGCITGKYLNENNTSPLVECAKRIDNTGTEKFEGKYFSTWLDFPTVPDHSELTITKNGDVYKLVWSDGKSQIWFQGQGMIVGDLLVGCYW